MWECAVIICRKPWWAVHCGAGAERRLDKRLPRGTPYVRRLFTGVYVPADVHVTEHLLVNGALMVLPADTLVTGVTALRRLGVQVGTVLPLQFVSTHPYQIRRSNLHVSRVNKLPLSRGRCVIPEHAFASAVKRLDLVDLVAGGDWLIRLKQCTRSSLQSYAKTFFGQHRARARQAAELVRERVDSPQETLLRLCLVRAGLPEPSCNLTIGTNDYPIGRVDLAYERFKVIIEYEGDQHRTDKWQWNVDIGRQEEFMAAGWTVIRVTAQRIRHPRALVGKVYTALQERGYRGPAPSFSTEWSALFELTARYSGFRVG